MQAGFHLFHIVWTNSLEPSANKQVGLKYTVYLYDTFGTYIVMIKCLYLYTIYILISVVNSGLFYETIAVYHSNLLVRIVYFSRNRIIKHDKFIASGPTNWRNKNETDGTGVSK